MAVGVGLGQPAAAAQQRAPGARVVDLDRRVRSAAAELGPPVALDDGEAPFAHAREHAEHQPPQWGLTPFARSMIACP